MDTTSDIQIEQTPFTFRGDEQALLAVVDRAVHNLRGRRISHYPIYPDMESIDDAAWIEQYTEIVRGFEVRRLRAIWIGTHSVERSNWTGPSFSYRCAYIDSADDDAAARIELRQRNIRQRDDESASMRLHIKLSPVQAVATTGRIEAPALLRFAVDAILLAIEEAGREVQTVTPTGETPSESVDQDTGKHAGDNKRQRNASTDAKVWEAHRLLRDGVIWEIVRKTCAHETYMRHCFDVTGEEPITK